MKSYIFTTVSERRLKTGGTNYTLLVYRVEKNIPKFICEVGANTAAHKGKHSEVFNKLQEIGETKIKGSYYVAYDMPKIIITEI